jgi:hypothetical protein
MLFDPAKPSRTRLLSFGGLIATLLMLVLGAIRPSPFTLIAILIIPAPFAFAVTIFRRAVFETWPKLRIYLIACVVASIVSWAVEVTWLGFVAHR